MDRFDERRRRLVHRPGGHGGGQGPGKAGGRAGETGGAHAPRGGSVRA